ncbi:MAG TPA: OsmC family protein [Actinomycetota bacterium]
MAVRRYAAAARSTDLVGRMRVDARHHHLTIDGPPWNDFPGEELMPGEAFLGGVAACAVELIQMFTRDDGIPVGDIDADVVAELDPDDQPHPDHTLFNRVRMAVRIHGVDQDQAEDLVRRFKGR